MAAEAEVAGAAGVAVAVVAGGALGTGRDVPKRTWTGYTRSPAGPVHVFEQRFLLWTP